MDPGRAPPMHLSVRLELPDKEPRTFEYDFEQAVVTLGRDPSNDIQVPLTTVSRNHARIFFERGDFFLEDLGSTHGTKHNDRPIATGEKRLLRAGDRIAIVSFHILFDTPTGLLVDRQPGERTEQLARRMVQGMLEQINVGAEPPSLRVMSGPDEGRRFVLSDDRAEIVIGRSPDCDITLEDANISRRHCLVKRSWHGFTAQDLGSRNGVLVNDRRVEGARMLRDGDELQVGGVKLTFIDPPSRLLASGGLDEEDDEESAAVAEEQPEEAPPEDIAYAGAADDLDPPFESQSEPPPDPFVPEVDPHPHEEDPAVPSMGGSFWEMAILAVGGLFLLGAAAFFLLVFS